MAPNLPLHQPGAQTRRVSRRRDPSQSTLFLVVISNHPHLSAVGDWFWRSADSWFDPPELSLSSRILIDLLQLVLRIL